VNIRRRAGLAVRALAFLLLVTLATAGWLGARALAAQRHLSAAQVDLETAGNELLAGNDARAGDALQSAQARTVRARSLVNDPVWRLAAAVPVAGASPRAVRELVGAADGVARMVLPPALEAAEALDPARLRAPDGRFDTAVIRAGTPPVLVAADRATEVSRRLQDLPTARLAPPLRERAAAFSTAATELSDALDTAASTVAAAPPLLGEDRPRRYLVLIQQPSEARAAGGLVGGYVELVADRGRVDVVSSGTNADFQRVDIEPPAELSPEFVRMYRSTRIFEYLPQVTITPQLPAIERIVQAQWQAMGGAPLDGVVLLDAVALSLLLDGTGPLPLADGEVLPEDLVDYLGFGQYVDFAPIDPGTFLRDGQDDQSEEIARVAAERLTSGEVDARTILEGLIAAGRSGHVRFATHDPVLGPLLDDVGITQGLPQGPAPVAYAVVNNITGSKLDHFLDRRISYRAGDCAGERRQSTVTVALTNSIPAGDLPPYVTIRVGAFGAGNTSARDLAYALSVYVTLGSELISATLDGTRIGPGGAADGPVLTQTTEAGLRRISVPVLVPEGTTQTLVLHLDEPVVPGAARVPEQPLARAAELQVDVPVCQ